MDLENGDGEMKKKRGRTFASRYVKPTVGRQFRGVDSSVVEKVSFSVFQTEYEIASEQHSSSSSPFILKTSAFCLQLLSSGDFSQFELKSHVPMWEL